MKWASFACVLPVVLVFSGQSQANQAQPVPIPEDAAILPQLEIDGVGIGTLGYGNPVDGNESSYRGGVGFSDSALLVGASQRLMEGGGLGSMGFGLLAPDTANSGTSNPILIHQAFLDLQTESTEWLIGRADSPASHLVDFPTIREEDLIVFTNPLDPFSNGASLEDHRYANVASFSLNQGLTYFETFHAEHLFDDRSVGGTNATLNSFGLSFEYLAKPGLEALSRVVSYGAGYQRQGDGTPRGINQFYAGGVLNLNESLTDRVDFRLLELVNLGANLSQLQSVMESYQASYSTTAVCIRYLHSPFGKPATQLALTAGYRAFFNVTQAGSLGLALTGVRRLGTGFDLVLQYETQWRDTALAGLYQNQTSENIAEIGFVLAFNSTFNAHLSPRRSLLNVQHQYIPD